MSTRSWDWKDLRDRLIAQGWRIESKDNRHVRCYPPDTSKPMVYSTIASGDMRAIKNFLSQLRRSGFDPDIEPGRRSSGGNGQGKVLAFTPVGKCLVPFHEAVRACRESHKLKPKDLAELVGFSTSTIYAWEKGTSVPHSRETWHKLCELFPELLEGVAVPKFRVDAGTTGRPASVEEAASTEPPPNTKPSEEVPAVQSAPEPVVAVESCAIPQVLSEVLLSIGEAVSGKRHRLEIEHDPDDRNSKLWLVTLWEECQIEVEEVGGCKVADEMREHVAAKAPTITEAMRAVLSKLRGEVDRKRAELERLAQHIPKEDA